MKKCFHCNKWVKKFVRISATDENGVLLDSERFCNTCYNQYYNIKVADLLNLSVGYLPNNEEQQNSKGSR